MALAQFSLIRLILVLLCAFVPTIIAVNNTPKPLIKSVNIPFEPIPKQVWALYIGLFGNPQTDGKWIHWRRKSNDWSHPFHEPPSSIGSFLYPQLGLYSSHDKNTIRTHMQMMRSAGIDAILFQWWGFNGTEGWGQENLGFSDKTFQLLLEIGEEFGIKSCIEIQPYRDRNSSSINNDITGILTKYSNHKSYLKINNRPVIVIFEPAGIEHLKFNTSNFPQKPYLIGTITDSEHVSYNTEQKMDGMFTFNANDFKVWSTNLTNWPYLRNDTHSRGSTFIAAVAPGHNNAKIDNWDRVERKRNGLEYYNKMWKAAIDAKSDIIVINSFNGWFDATNIEPAFQRPGYKFNKDIWSGENGNPNDFLEATKQWSEKFKSEL